MAAPEESTIACWGALHISPSACSKCMPQKRLQIVPKGHSATQADGHVACCTTLTTRVHHVCSDQSFPADLAQAQAVVPPWVVGSWVPCSGSQGS